MSKAHENTGEDGQRSALLKRIVDLANAGMKRQTAKIVRLADYASRPQPFKNTEK